MKPFDIERAMAGDAVCYRDGKPARLICFNLGAKRKYDDFDDTYNIVSYHEKYGLSTHIDNGRSIGGGKETEFDLFMVDKVVKYWVNVYKSIGVIPITKSTYTREEAALREKDNPDYIKTISFEVEE